MNAMNNIKKQFKDFWLYYKLTKHGVNTSGTDLLKNNIVMFISTVIVCLLAIFQFSFKDGDMLFSVSGFVLFVPFAVGAAVGMGILTTKQPSLLSVSPFSPKQRMVFCYLAAIVRAVVLFVFAVVCAIIALFVIGCLFSIVNGQWVFVIEGSVGDVGGNGHVVYESLFLLLLSVTHFFAFFAISHVDNAKARNIASVVYAAVTLALSLVVIYICDRAGAVYTSYVHFTTDLSRGLYGKHAAWILSIEAVFTALAIVASVFFVRKRFASTEV